MLILEKNTCAEVVDPWAVDPEVELGAELEEVGGDEGTGVAGGDPDGDPDGQRIIQCCGEDYQTIVIGAQYAMKFHLHFAPSAR